MKKTILALLATQALFAHNINSDKPTVEFKDSTFFELGFGKGLISIDDNTYNTTLTSGALSDKPYMIDAGFGFGIDEHLSAGLHYQYNNLDIGNIENIYLNLDYKLHLDSLHYSKYDSLSMWEPFVGLMLGTSSLTWDESPVAGATSTSSTSSKFFYGFEAGLIRPISDETSISFKYQYSDLGHKTVIGDETIYHNGINGFIFSINYKGDLLK